MNAVQIMGKRISVAKVAELFAELAESLKGLDTTVVGSLDKDEYGTQMSFNLEGSVISFSILEMKGAEQ